MKEKAPVMAIAGIGLLILLGTFIMNFLIMRKVGSLKTTSTKETVGESKELGPLVSLGDPITVNLKEPEHFARVQLVLELQASAVNEGKKGKGEEAGGSSAAEKEVTAREAVIRDAVIRILRAKSFVELKDPIAQDLLKKEILQAVDRIMGKNRIKAVYFKDFVME